MPRLVDYNRKVLLQDNTLIMYLLKTRSISINKKIYYFYNKSQKIKLKRALRTINYQLLAEKQ